MAFAQELGAKRIGGAGLRGTAAVTAGEHHNVVRR